MQTCFTGKILLIVSSVCDVIYPRAVDSIYGLGVDKTAPWGTVTYGDDVLTK